MALSQVCIAGKPVNRVRIGGKSNTRRLREKLGRERGESREWREEI
jgi:hypothetical protein